MKRKSLAGIENAGYSCYMSAALSVLYNIQHVQDKFEQDDYLNKF